MAVVNVHVRPALNQREVTLQPTRFFGTSDPASLKFWLTGIAFLALYSVLNKMTVYHQLDGLGITLWSPDNGLSLLLLTEGIIFAPFVLLGAVLTDVFVLRVDHSLYVTVAVELVLTVCYVSLAAILRHKLKFNPRGARLSNVVVLLIVVPVCTARSRRISS
jgi:integral membrane sensor domain MASE1